MRNNTFKVDNSWQILVKDLGISPQDVLRHARLPLDLFNRPSPTLTTEQYFRMWDGLSHALGGPTFPLQLGQSVTFEAFSPPLFACFCSPNLNIALTRLSEYKPLVGPLRLDITQTEEQTTVAIAGLPESGPTPPTLIAFELVFMTAVARLATREHIVPLAVYSREPLPEVGAYEAYFGVQVQAADFSGVSFSSEDAARPFLTANEAIWNTFEPELRKRMADLGIEAPFRERVRAILVETLASGQVTMDDVAHRLAVSTRTLQRRLTEEDTSFREELNALREALAQHYLANTRYTSAEIAFLLGYQDPNSFFRAFNAWTGQTPELARATIQQQ